MTVSRFALLVILASVATTLAAEPQWIWSTKEAATKAEQGEVAFRKTFNVENAEAATVTITADNGYDLFINGRHVGSGEGWAQRTRYDVKPLLLPGRNLVAVRATNSGADPAGLAAQIEVKPQGKPAMQIPSDASWKYATKFGGRWATQEFDDSGWEPAAALGTYGKSGPWGAAGPIVESKLATTALAKAKNTERGLFEFKDKDRLVLLGSAFIERMQNNGYFELEFISAHPHKDITVRNLGWSGDTVWGDARAVFGTRADGFKRLVNDVNLCEPTVILVCYGENEAYAGVAGLDDFHAGFETLLDALEATGARIVVATPRKHENVGEPFPDPTQYNADLRKYCDVMKEVATEREHTFVDWFDVAKDQQLTENGIHLLPVNYLKTAQEMVASLGGSFPNWKIDIDLNEQTLNANGTTVTDLKRTPTGLTFSAIEHRPMRAKYLRVRGLPPGDYKLLRNDKEYQFIIGDTLTREGGCEMWPTDEDDERKDRLLAAINEKNFLFFNRYRPQNETYLFLFRKHEQGNNAVEIPQFDPLIAEQEKIIAELKKPPKQKFELKRVSE
jgi:hypothetical protein